MRGRYARPAERVRQSLTVRRSRPQLTHERYRALRNFGSVVNAAGRWDVERVKREVAIFLLSLGATM